MFRSISFALVLVSACATMQPISDVGGPRRIGTHFELKPVLAADDTHRVFPRLIGDAAFPSAQHLSTALLATQDKYELSVRICVAPTGAVTRVDLEASSGAPELDRAALHDIRNWGYEPMPGPATVQNCAPMTLDYTP